MTFAAFFRGRHCNFGRRELLPHHYGTPVTGRIETALLSQTPPNKLPVDDAIAEAHANAILLSTTKACGGFRP